MKKYYLSFGLLLTVSLAIVVFNSCGKEKKDNPLEQEQKACEMQSHPDSTYSWNPTKNKCEATYTGKPKPQKYNMQMEFSEAKKWTVLQSAASGKNLVDSLQKAIHAKFTETGILPDTMKLVSTNDFGTTTSNRMGYALDRINAVKHFSDSIAIVNGIPIVVYRGYGDVDAYFNEGDIEKYLNLGFNARNK